MICSHESQPTTNKNYGEGVIESINGRFERIVQSFDALCSVLVAGEKLVIVVAGEEKTNNEYDERVVYETQ